MGGFAPPYFFAMKKNLNVICYDSIVKPMDVPSLGDAIAEFNRTGQFILSHRISGDSLNPDAKEVHEVAALNMESFGSGDYNLFEVAVAQKQAKFNLHPSVAPLPSSETSSSPDSSAPAGNTPASE